MTKNHHESRVVETHDANPQGIVENIPQRDGATYHHERDGRRLHNQHNRVLAHLRANGWVTLSEIAAATGDPEASVSARLRDLRKPKFGGYEIERRYVRRGLHQYRLAFGQQEMFS